MIGFYDYTVVLTYVSLVISLFGIFSAVRGNVLVAILCLALSGLCDMFDGKIARTKKNRTADEKSFGIQLDSLCDVICFAVFPSVLCWRLGVRGLFGFALMSFFCICGVIRLAYFNVLEGKRQQEEEGLMRYYHGLPITSTAVILPFLLLLRFVMAGTMFRVVLHVALFMIGLLFITDFPLKKPKNRTLAAIVAAVALALVVLTSLGFRNQRVSSPVELAGNINRLFLSEPEDSI